MAATEIIVASTEAITVIASTETITIIAETGTVAVAEVLLAAVEGETLLSGELLIPTEVKLAEEEESGEEIQMEKAPPPHLLLSEDVVSSEPDQGHNSVMSSTEVVADILGDVVA